jgi:hypothetical protein
MTDTEKTLFEIAQSYSKVGYVCIPVTVTLDERDKKRVAAPDDWPNRKFDRPEDWEDWAGIAFDCSRSGIVAVDIDTSHGKDGVAGLKRAGISFPPTPASLRSQSGGQHGIYRACSIPLRDSTSKLADDVDIKAFGLLITAPTEVAPGREYTWLRGEDVPAAALPEFPEDLAKLLAESKSKYVVSLVDYTPAEVTPEQREWALQRIDYKLQELTEASPGGNWEASKVLMRIFGLAKTLGEDLESIAGKCEAASCDDDEARFAGSIARAMRSAKPEDPRMWLATDREAAFWCQRPELAHIRDAAEGGTASPWAVLGAVCVRVLADVPPSWTLDTGIGISEGNLNLFVVLAANPGGGKGIATEMAEHLWRCADDVYITDAASGEGLAKLFVGRDGTPIRSSAIIDVDEYSSLKSTADRSGSTLSSKLSSGWSGKRFSMAYSDESKNFSVPAGSYRLGLIAGIQYGNAKMLLSSGDEVQGFPHRFVWFPAEVEYNPAAQDAPTEPPKRLAPMHAVGRRRIAVPDHIKAQMRAARAGAPGLDGHKLYAQVKLAYALAVLNGHTESVRDEDWRLAQVVMQVSARTMAKAQQEMRARSRREHLSRGESDGIRQAAAEDTAHDHAVDRVARWIARKREEFPGITDNDLRKKAAGRDLKIFTEALDVANS